jgi:hypothetical protein
MSDPHDADPPSGGAMRATVLRGADARALLDDPRWDDLVRSRPRPNPTLLGCWQRALLGLGAGTPLAVAVEQGARLVAGGAFATRATARGRLTMACWPGGSFQPFSPDVLAESPAAADALVDALLGEVGLVRLWAVGRGPLVAALRRRAPWASIRAGRASTWVVSLPLRPELRSGQVRELAKDERRALRAGVALDISVAERPEDAVPAVVRLFRLHRERWAGRPEENASFSSTRRTRAVYREAVAAAARAGYVRVIEVRERAGGEAGGDGGGEGRLVASQLALLAGRGAVTHTTAMSRGTSRSPGHHAFLATLDLMAEAGCELVDIGGGALESTSPKGRLAPAHDPFVEIAAARSPSIQRLIGLGITARAAARAARRPLGRQAAAR